MKLKTLGVTLTTTIMIMMSAFVVSAADTTGVSIDENNFPDEVFRNYVSTEFDSDSDGMLSADEMEAVTQISVTRYDGIGYAESVTSLKGIEYFTNLEYLYCDNNIELFNIDVSKNTALKYMNILCTGIMNLDLSNNPKLQSVSYNIIELGQIESSYDLTDKHPDFDTTKVFDCTGAECIDGKLTNFTSAEGSYWYDCGNGVSMLVEFSHVHNYIDGACSACGSKAIFINADNFPDEVFRNYVRGRADSNADGIFSKEELEAVKGIYVNGEMGYGVIYDGGITSLKGIEHFTEIKYLKCEYNSELKEMDISKNTKLEEVYCYYTGLTGLDLSKNTELMILDCYNTSLTSLDVTKNAKLSELNCSATGITSLDVSKNAELNTLICGTMDIADIDVSNNANLWNLSCSYTKVSELDLSKNIALMNLYCDNTRITSLDVSKNSQLQRLDCSNTGITELRFDNNAIITELNCSNTGITSLDVVANDRLGVLDCSDTEIVSLNINNHLVRINCSNTKLESIATGDNEHLMELICSGSSITELDLSKSKRLWGLDCSDTPITKLDVSNNADLMELDCSGTNITSLDLTGCDMLEKLYCSNTKLTSLDLSRNYDLEEVELNNNAFYIGEDASVYDLGSLPGFNVAKASEWNGATYANGKLTGIVPGTKITYKYDCGNGFYVIFTLTTKEIESGNPEGVVDFVNRMYSIILNREPDAGSETWVELLINGSYTGAKVAEGFIMSEEFLSKDISNEEFVKIMYRAFFNREADEGGLATWKGCLDGGYIKKFVFAGFANSDEFKALCDTYGINSGVINLTLAERTPNLSEKDFNIWQFVERFYSEVMGRNPDQTGMDTWVGVLKSGEYTGVQVAEGFIISDEFLNKDMTNEEYVRIMYRAFFNRDADAVGLETWTGALDSGWTKRAVFAGFANSNEFSALCDAYGITQGSVEAE